MALRSRALRKTKKISDEVTIDTFRRLLPRNWMDILLDEMDSRCGVGIAAPQVGWNVRIIVVQGIVMINPEILEYSEEWEYSVEGCLSLPDIPHMPVKRFKQVLVAWTTHTGKERQQLFSGLEAFIVQHEIDHLNGLHYTDRVTEHER
jgi:peptide deformylase